MPKSTRSNKKVLSSKKLIAIISVTSIIVFATTVLSLYTIFYIKPTVNTDQVLGKSTLSTPNMYTAGEILISIKNDKTITEKKVRTITGLSDAKITMLSDGVYLIKSDKLRNDFNRLSSSARDLSMTNSVDKYHSNIISKLNTASEIKYAEVNGKATLLEAPNDPEAYRQYALTKMQIEEAWNLSNITGEIVVGVVDTGVNSTHQDLINKMWINPKEIPNNNKDDDKNGYIDDIHGMSGTESVPAGKPGTFDTNIDSHGTHVAGIIAAETNNNIGVAGICKRCKIMAIKVFNQSSTSHTSEIIRGLNYALKTPGIKVLNHSYTIGYSTIYADLMRKLHKKGIISIVAAGNDSRTVSDMPASLTRENIVFTIAATTKSDVLAGFSNYGTTDTLIDFTAPGYDILSTGEGDTYALKQGTSLAAPQVTGIIGLMLGLNSRLTYNDIKTHLIAGAENIDIHNPALARQIGFGRVNALKTINNMGINPITPTPIPSPTTISGLPDLYLQSTDLTSPKTAGTPIGGIKLTIQNTTNSNFPLNATSGIVNIKINISKRNMGSNSNFWSNVCNISGMTSISVSNMETKQIDFSSYGNMASLCGSIEAGKEYLVKSSINIPVTYEESSTSNNSSSFTFNAQ